MRRHIRGDEPDVVHWHPPITDGRMAGRNVVVLHHLALRKCPTIRAPAALTIAAWAKIAAGAADVGKIDTKPRRRIGILFSRRRVRGVRGISIELWRLGLTDLGCAVLPSLGIEVWGGVRPTIIDGRVKVESP